MKVFQCLIVLGFFAGLTIVVDNLGLPPIVHWFTVIAGVWVIHEITTDKAAVLSYPTDEKLAAISDKIRTNKIFCDNIVKLTNEELAEKLSFGISETAYLKKYAIETQKANEEQVNLAKEKAEFNDILEELSARPIEKQDT
jgi:hypothetical protein